MRITDLPDDVARCQRLSAFSGTAYTIRESGLENLSVEYSNTWPRRSGGPGLLPGLRLMQQSYQSTILDFFPNADTPDDDTRMDL